MGSPWVQTHSGRALDLLSPDPADVRLEDVSFGLAGLNRYSGQVRYTVAEHCCHVADFIEARAAWVYRNLGEAGQALRHELALAGLLHDAPEAYTNDLTHPLIVALGPEFRARLAVLQEGVWQAIRAALRLPPEVDIHAPAVKWVDRQICLDERDALLGPSPRPPGDGWPEGELLGVRIEGWDDIRAESEWLQRFERLRREVRP